MVNFLTSQPIAMRPSLCDWYPLPNTASEIKRTVWGDPQLCASRGTFRSCTLCELRGSPDPPTLRFSKTKARWSFDQQALFITRQRPTFPLPHSSSSIGPGGLNFRVRYGNGWYPSGKATGNSQRDTAAPFTRI